MMTAGTKFGKQFLSNSDISTLLTNPLALGEQSKMSSAFLVGGYFHTAILEPDKLKKFKIIESSTRNTKHYKEMSGGELCLLQHEVDKIELMTEKLMKNDKNPGIEIRDSTILFSSAYMTGLRCYPPNYPARAQTYSPL